MTILRVLLHVAAQRDYDLHSLDFSTAFLQGSLHEEWHNTLSDLCFQPSSADPSLFVRRGSTPFFVLVFVDDLVFATADRVALADVKHKLQKKHTCTALGELCHYLGVQITRDRAACTITLSQSHMVQQHPCSLCCARETPSCSLDSGCEAKYLATTSSVGLVLGGGQSVVLTGQCDSFYADDAETHQSTQGYCFSLGSGAVSWRSTRSSSVSTSTAEVEIYAGAMAIQELRWLTFLLSDLGERPRSAPTLFTDNKASILLCREPRLESRVKHINVRYFFLRELQGRGQARFDFVESEANTADIFTKALLPCDHQRCCVQL
ncbi:unnamed protein product, partial [Closterium sp. NIES-53]